MKSVMELQAALQSASAEQASPNTTTEPSDEYTSIAKIQQVAPQLNLEYVINQLAPKRFDRSRIGFPAPDFYRKLSQAISTTPAEVIQAFFVWKSIVSLSRYIDSPQTAAYNRFEAEQGGQDAGSPPPRWMRCAKLLDEGVAWIADDNTASVAVGPTGLTWILARFFADKNFTPEAKKLTSKIIDNLEEAFIGRIQTRAWATSKVKKAATEKVRAMANKIGLPTSPNAIDPHALKEFYGDINITPSLAQNVLSFAKSRISKNWASLGKPYDPSQFPSSTLTTNAFHEPQGNDMVILAGIQQSPLYNINYPAYITYGGMGSIVGHEITHGFDDNGRLYDKTGNQSSWFDDQSTEGFEKSAECFVNQYSKFVITGPDGKKEHIDGNLTLGENIADVGGVLSSFSAWKKWEGDNGKAQDLPGLGNFTHEQLFFVKWGQAWCENRKPEQVIAGLADVHSPNSARILLPLENSVDFQRAFNCPQKKPVCELW
jgi:endothelin-converting enzyme